VGVTVSTHEAPAYGRFPILSRRGSFARASLATLAMRAGARLLALPTALILARTLGPARYGAYAYGLGWAVLLGLVAVFGLDRFLVRTVAGYAAVDDSARVRGVVRWGARAATLTSITLAGAFAAIAPLFVKSSLLPATWICLALVPLFALTAIRQAVMQGLGRVELSFVPDQMVFPAALLVLVAVVVGTHAVDLDARWAAVLNVSASGLAFLLGVALVRRSLTATTEAATPRGEPREWSRSLAPFAVIGFVTLAQVQAGVLILGSLGRASDAGVYQVAARVAEVASFALIAINAPLAPRVARLHALGDRRDLAGLARRTARVSFAVCLPLALLAVAFRGPLLHLFGSGYGAGTTALVFLVAAQAVSAFAGPVGVVLMMSGGERIAAFGFAVGLVVGVGCGIPLASAYGATGAAIGQCLGVAAWNLALWAAVRRRLGIDASVLGISEVSDG